MDQRVPNYYTHLQEQNPNFPPQSYHHNEQQTPFYSHYPNSPAPPPTPFSVYAKPAQPQNWPPFMQQNPHFYPQQQQQAQQPTNSLIAYFQDQNGQMDYGKMLTTVSQVANTFQQVTPVVQQISSIINSFR